MAPKKKNVPKRKYLEYDHEDLEAALEKYYREKVSLRSIGREFGIPESTLRGKIIAQYEGQGNSKRLKAGRKTLLTPAEEHLLVNYIRDSVKRAMPLTRLNVLSAVKEILAKDQSQGYLRDQYIPESEHLGWWRGFKKRWPSIVYRTPETLSTARRNLCEPIIKQWFSDVVSYFADKNILDVLEDPTRIFNLDESGFSLSPKSGKVLALKEQKHCFHEQSNRSKTNITILTAVRADGALVTPMVIFPLKRISVGISQQVNKLSNKYDCSIGKSDNGYITFETFYEYMLNDFDAWLTTNNVKRPVVVYTDWHETRNNLHLSQALEARQIIMVGLVPNTTHILQPLDVAVFRPLKLSWYKATRKYLEEHDEFITQNSFVSVAIPLLYETVTETNIRSGFSKYGLYPLNDESPDYTKLQASAARRESGSSIYEGIIQGGRVETSTQTNKKKVLDKKVQVVTNNAADIIKVAFPDLANKTKDDLVLDQAKYASMINMMRLLDLNVPKKEVDMPTSTQRPISPAFSEFNFYPERREGKGPKYVKSDTDKAYVLSSKLVVNEIYKDPKRVELEKKKKELEKKRKESKDNKGKVKTTEKKTPPPKKTPPSKKTPPPKKTPPSMKTPPPKNTLPDKASYFSTRAKTPRRSKTLPSFEDPDSPASSQAFSPEVEMVESGVEFSLDRLDKEYLDGVKWPLETAELQSWVGAKVTKLVETSRGRQISVTDIRIGKVSSINKKSGFTVNFYKEHAKGFYRPSHPKDVATHLSMSDLIVLQKPKEGYNREYKIIGCDFGVNIIENIKHWFVRI